MNIKEIKALAAVLRQADLTSLEYSQGDMHIKLERCGGGMVTIQQPAAIQTALPAAGNSPQALDTNDFNNLCEVKAPMVGVFYAAPAPDAKPYVRVGDMVEKGQVIGELVVLYDGREIAATPLAAAESVGRKSFFLMLYQEVRDLLQMTGI